MRSEASTSRMRSCAAAASRRNGASFITSAAISDQPSASGTTHSVGGRVQPLGKGETSRTSQPLGAIRKARPTAKAACGTASSGGRLAVTSCHQRVPCTETSVRSTRAKASSVAKMPLFSVSSAAGSARGSASMAANPAPSEAPDAGPDPRPDTEPDGARLGSKPSAGSSVPSRPAASGAAKARTISQPSAISPARAPLEPLAKPLATRAGRRRAGDARYWP